MSAPNIVLICADDIGFNEIGAYRNTGMPDRDVYAGKHVLTPNIDSIANDGAILRGTTPRVPSARPAAIPS